MHSPALLHVTWATYCTSITLSGLAPGVSVSQGLPHRAVVRMT